MKQFLVLLLLTCALSVQAQTTRWCVVDTDHPDEPVALMSNVAYLLVSDWNDQFAIVCKDGTLCPGLQSISFRQLDVTAVGQPKVQDSPAVLADAASHMLTLSGLKAGTPVQVYNAAGHLLRTLKAAEGKTEITLEALPSGVYLLKAGETTIKFLKK